MAPSVQRAESSSAPTLAGRVVLVVEDDPDSRDLLTVVLESLHARVVAATTIEEAERKLTMYGVNLVICDMKLPDGTGRDFITWLRVQGAKVKATPTIAITAYENDFPLKAATGFDAYMRKPINLDKLCSVVVALARG